MGAPPDYDCGKIYSLGKSSHLVWTTFHCGLRSDPEPDLKDRAPACTDCCCKSLVLASSCVSGHSMEETSNVPHVINAPYTKGEISNSESAL